MPASPAVQSIDPIPANGSAGPARSSPWPPQAVARSARLEGGGTGEHAYGQSYDRSLPAPDEQVCRRRGHRSLRGPVQHRPQHRIREATPPCPERGLHGCSRSEEFAVARARPGRDSFPLCSAAELVSLMLFYTVAKRSSSQRKVELSRHIWCRITASLRATATYAFLLPTRSISDKPQRLSAHGRLQRLISVQAAS